MFDLEQAIIKWRQDLAAVINSREALDELETHLRADITQHAHSGLAPEEAFRLALRRIGPPDALAAEFRKAGAAWPQKIMISLCIILLAFILWLSGFTFARMQFGPSEQIVAWSGIVLSLLVACRWRYAVPFLPVISGKAKRIAVGVGCIALGLTITNLLSQFVVPLFDHSYDRQLPAIGFWLLFPIAVGSCLGLALMMSARDREHWSLGGPGRSSPTTP